MIERLHLLVTNLIRNKHKGVGAWILLGVLRCLSFPCQAVIRCRNWAYDYKFLTASAPEKTLIISVGNIVAGGTGKTPITALLAKTLSAQFQVAILTRGYRSPLEKKSMPVQISKGEGPSLPAAICGDEPYLLSSRVPQALVFVGRNRREAARMAAAQHAKIVVLDDGMQHRQLARQKEIVVVNARDPLGQGYYLPRGFLRDEPHSLKRSHLLIATNIKDSSDYTQLQNILSKYSQSPLVGVQMKLIGFRNSKHFIEVLPARSRLGVFCGIAYPENFLEMLQRQYSSNTIVAQQFYPDHHRFSLQEVESFAQNCMQQGANMIICTEKDWVKLDPSFTSSYPVFWADATPTIVAGEEYWQQFLHEVERDVRTCSKSF